MGQRKEGELLWHLTPEPKTRKKWTRAAYEGAVEYGSSPTKVQVTFTQAIRNAKDKLSIK